MAKPAMPIKEFCALWNVGLTKAYAEINAGRLIARKLGRRTIILNEDAERWAAALPPIASKAATNA